MIARANGEKFEPGDPYAKQIIYDMIVLHLKNNVLDNRAISGGPGCERDTR